MPFVIVQNMAIFFFARTGILRKETLIGVNSPITNNVSTTETPKKRAVRFNVESKCDLAINFVNKQAQNIHVKKIKAGGTVHSY
jgi:hypothetical protein